MIVKNGAEVIRHPAYDQPSPTHSNGCEIVVSNLTKCIKGVRVLDDISLGIPRGTTVGLSGANGSGKTMFMRAILGLIKPTSGTVSIDGLTLWDNIAFPPSVGVLLEGPAFLANKSGLDNLALLASIRNVIGPDACAAAIRDVGLDPTDRRPYRKYSLGMKQRLGIAAAIMECPRLIVLDEPTNALDSAGVEMAVKVIRKQQERGATLIMACHAADILRSLTSEIYFLAEGHIDGHEVMTKKGGES